MEFSLVIYFNAGTYMLVNSFFLSQREKKYKYLTQNSVYVILHRIQKEKVDGASRKSAELEKNDKISVLCCGYT